MGSERSKLHNFTLPCDLRWKNQRLLRCMKVNMGGQISPRHRVDPNNTDQHHQIQQRRPTSDKEGARQRSKDLPNKRRIVDDDDEGIPAKRGKVMLDLQTATDKMKSEVSASPPIPAPAAASSEGEIQRPWNLRTRRSACRTPGIGFVAAGAGSNGGGAKGPSGKKLEGAKFSLSLSKTEIEEDFFSFGGHRPLRKPKKRRTKVVQKHLDTMLPRLWVTEVTPGMYKVPGAY